MPTEEWDRQADLARRGAGLCEGIPLASAETGPSTDEEDEEKEEEEELMEATIGGGEPNTKERRRTLGAMAGSGAASGPLVPLLAQNESNEREEEEEKEEEEAEEEEEARDAKIGPVTVMACSSAKSESNSCSFWFIQADEDSAAGMGGEARMCSSPALRSPSVRPVAEPTALS